MDPYFVREHEKLFSGASLLLGKSFWYILRADTLVCGEHFHRISGSYPLGPFDTSKALTQNADFVSLDEIHWWVFQQENNHKILHEKTEIVMQHLHKLKLDADKLDPRSPSDYPEIITELKNFTESHSEEINAFYDYVQWLVKIDPVAPIILFSNKRWGETRRNERSMYVFDSIDADTERVQFCTEIALGLRDKMGLNLVWFCNELDNENQKRDPKNYRPGNISKKDAIFRTSRQAFKELFIFLELLRDSLREVIKEIDDFNSCSSPVIRKLNIGERRRSTVRFCLVQLDFSLKISTGDFGFVPEKEELLRRKIFSAVKISQENDVDIICFPELSFKKGWVEELIPQSKNMVIICGSYYEESYNVCPVIIQCHTAPLPYKKHNPSSAELGVVVDKGMKPGMIVYIYKTDFGTFSTLTCIDYAKLSHQIMAESGGDLDFIINPCYDENIKRFQAQCNSDCENHDLTIIQINRADGSDGKYGKSCIISKEHKTIIDSFTSAHFRDSDDVKYLLAKLRNEEMIIADLNLDTKAPPVDLPVTYPGRLKIVRCYDYNHSNWILQLEWN
jgi:hypothetical protein